MQNEQSESQGSVSISRAAVTAPRHVPGLEGLSGKVRFDVGQTPFVTLKIHDGDVEATREQGADAVVRCKTEEEALRLLRGEVSPMVAALQGRLEELEGSAGLAARVLLSLQAASPFKTVSA